MYLSIYCDGGSRGNPGPAASAFIVKDETDNVIYEQGFYLGVATNNQAEYQAVIESLKWLSSETKRYPLFSIHYYLDSLLVVNQLKGLYKIKDSNLKIKNLEIKKITERYPLNAIHFQYIPREKNYLADALVNKTLDANR